MSSRLLPDGIDLYGGSSAITRAITLQQPAVQTAEFGAPGLSVLLRSRGTPEQVLRFSEMMGQAASLFEGAGVALELVVADSVGGGESVMEYFDNDPPAGVRFLDSRRQRPAQLNNELSGLARNDRLLFCDSDVTFTDPSQMLYLWELSYEWGPDPLGVVLSHPDGTVTDAGLEYLRGGLTAGADPRQSQGSGPPQVREVLAANGACLVVGRDWLRRVGGFDESFEVECHDTDFCLSAARLGARIGIADLGLVTRPANPTATPQQADRPDRTLFARRWQSYLEGRFR
ncbi:MAG: hypothetical protein KDC39_10635 [Actinobacteria bacterium]|nr:hypothetical protein [Actinomycetota bacterium]